MLDWSGSMSMSSKEVFGLISDAPRKTDVACYSGSSREGGRIIVCAKKGRFIDEVTLNRLKTGGGTVVDGPALSWLCRMPKPRIWISDGHIFGQGGSVAHGGKFLRREPIDKPMIDEFYATMLKYNVIRCENIFQAMLVLRQHVSRESPIFYDMPHQSLAIGRTAEANQAWFKFREENSPKQWYRDLTKEVRRHGQYADW